MNHVGSLTPQRRPTVIDSERFKLLYGPYVAPRCALGDKLPCEYRGREVTVKRISEAPVQWPCTRGKSRPSPILCGDLIRAVRTESEIAVAYHWGVGYPTVWKWRRALNVSRMTNGSRRLRIEYAAETLTPEVRAKGKEAMHSPDVRAKLSVLKKGRRQHPNTTAAFREIARRPKSEEWKRGMSERARKMWENPEAHGFPARRNWTDDEIALLGTDTDRAIANRLGIPVRSVESKRRRLGILRPRESWTEQELALLGTEPDDRLALKLGRPVSAIQRKRTQLGIGAFTAFKWTEENLALLGTVSDNELARKLGISAGRVFWKREKLGIPAFFVRWSPAEIAFLGTDTDGNVARLLGRSETAVRNQRTHLKIPAYR
jgi:hypothetical protein